MGNTWKRAILRRQIYFLNRNGEIIDWDNNYLSELVTVNKQPQLIHRGIISEIPCIETDNMYDGIIGSILISNTNTPPSYAEHVAKVHINVVLDTIEQAQGVDKEHDEVIIIDDGKDGSGGNLYGGYLLTGVLISLFQEKKTQRMVS